MSQPVEGPAPGPVANPVSVNIVACVALPNGIQLWVVGDAKSAQSLARSLNGRNLLLTLENVQQMWEQATGRIIVPKLMPKLEGKH